MTRSCLISWRCLQRSHMKLPRLRRVQGERGRKVCLSVLWEARGTHSYKYLSLWLWQRQKQPTLQLGEFCKGLSGQKQGQCAETGQCTVDSRVDTKRSYAVVKGKLFNARMHGSRSYFHHLLTSYGTLGKWLNLSMPQCLGSKYGAHGHVCRHFSYPLLCVFCRRVFIL